MQPKNSNTRTKRILGFAGLYAASLGLLFLILAAVGIQFSEVQQPMSRKEPAEYSVLSNQLLQADSVLHTGFYRLLQLDEQLALLRQDTSTASLRTTAFSVTDNAAQSLQKSIDSLDQLSSLYAGTEKAAAYSIIMRSFRAALAKRNTSENRSAYTAGIVSMATNGKQTAFPGSNELWLKNNEITALKAEIRELQNTSFASLKKAGNAEAGNGEIALLKTAFADQQKEYELLRERYNRLKAENNTLAVQVTEGKKNAVPKVDNAMATADSRIAQLEQQVQLLNTDLYFARIDCNLERADARQMISNARQRKELLSASLNMLKELSSVDNALVQKKAKEKIARLTLIANTLHD